MKAKQILSLLLTLVLIVSLIPAKSVAAKSNSTVTLTVGQTTQLTLKNAPKGKTVKWSSNKKKIATVTKKGKVTAKKAGTAKITAKVGKKKYTCIITVKAKQKTPATETTMTEEPTIEITATEETATETPTTEMPTIAIPTTEKQTTETVTTEKPTTEKVTTAKEETIPSITYQAHVQNIGWMSSVKDGVTAGTTGQEKRLESLKVTLKDEKGNSMIQYRAHIENVGWQGWQTSGQTAGTEHQAKRMEGIQIQLTGTYATKYDIYYRAHVANFGWLGWSKNGETAGSEGIALQMEAIQIKLVKKNGAFSVGGRHAIVAPTLTYQAHCANIGWQAAVSKGKTAGTTGENRQLEGIKINLLDTDGKSGVEYRAHVSNIGWQSWKDSGALAGTTGESRKLEAIEIKLKGSIAKDFDIYYRVHVANIGWLGWAKNGETAGTTGGARQAEAIQIKLIAKGATIDRGGAAYQKLTQSGYNANAALSYAASHWNDGQGLCAEFVSKCVQAGGIAIPTETITTNCYNAVSNATGVQGQVLKLDANGYATKSLDGNILSAGDVVIQWCNTHTYRPHILLCGGYDSSGYATFYAHNNPLNNGRFRFNMVGSSTRCPGNNDNRNCDIGARVLHISAGN